MVKKYDRNVFEFVVDAHIFQEYNHERVELFLVDIRMNHEIFTT